MCENSGKNKKWQNFKNGRPAKSHIRYLQNTVFTDLNRYCRTCLTSGHRSDDFYLKWNLMNLFFLHTTVNKTSSVTQSACQQNFQSHATKFTRMQEFKFLMLQHFLSPPPHPWTKKQHLQYVYLVNSPFFKKKPSDRKRSVQKIGELQ